MFWFLFSFSLKTMFYTMVDNVGTVANTIFDSILLQHWKAK